MNGAIIISWGAPVRGRETKSLEVFATALAHFEHLFKQGRIHAHKEYFNVTGAAGGKMIVEGQLDELLKIQVEENTRRVIIQAEAIVEDFNVQILTGGSDATVQQQVQTFAETLQGLGYM